jgi:predicted alpha-1,2-mannosidase
VCAAASVLLITLFGQGRVAAAGDATPLGSARPLVGTDDHGHTFPGACVPFGMVQLSPDTRTEGWDACSGYHYSDSTILGFSHNHLTGTGCPEMGNVLLLPGVGPIHAPVSKRGAGLRFSHDQETATPGYYRVVFPDPKITAELTATPRCGLHRYRFAAADDAHVVVDLRHGLPGNRTLAGAIRVESDRVLSGSRRSDAFAGDKTFYFVAQFSRPFQEVAIHVDGKPREGKQGQGKLVWAGVRFGALGDEPLVVNVGISAVSVEGARANLRAEVAERSFDDVASAARSAWREQLSLIDAQFAGDADRETFYSALYHAQLCPSLFCDVDGSFWGPDGKGHSPEGFSYYTSFSLWDTFRAEHALLILTAPDRVADMVKTMLAHYRIYAHHNLPCNVYGGHETWCMIGNHAIPVITEAYAKGIRNFDAAAALDAMLDSMRQDRFHLDEYRALGYIIHGTDDQKPNVVPDNQKQSVSRTLEYAYNDACIARFAAMLGRQRDAADSARRATNWRNVFDPATGFMRGKTAAGKFVGPFDPRVITFDDYTEANAWHYAFFVPHDVPGLIAAMGGDAVLVRMLDTLFTTSSELPVARSDVTGLIGQYAHGNEPCHHVAYLYNYAGAPWKSQYWLRKIMNVLYNNTPAGLCGNDDCGQMSAWYVWSALGMYPVDPTSGVYVLGSPTVRRAVIRLNGKQAKGKTFSIIARNNSAENLYIQSATLNGKPLARSWIGHQEILAGGALVLEMGPRPNKSWGADAKDRPPQNLP